MSLTSRGLSLLRAARTATISARGAKRSEFSLVSVMFLVREVQEGNVITVSLVDEPLPEAERVYPRPSHSCPLCAIPQKISYTDVLILEQFMRPDGTVLPMELTGLCTKQQLRLERCVMQAHWSGLFPDRTLPELDRTGYRKFQRYWDDDLDMYRLKEKMEPASWYFIKRYVSKKGEFGLPLPRSK